MAKAPCAQVDEVHQAHGDGQADRKDEQQHAVGNAVEEDGQHKGGVRVVLAGNSAESGQQKSEGGCHRFFACRLPPVVSGQISRLTGFAWVFDVFDHIKFHVVQLAVFLLHFAQVDVLHDVAGLGVDEDRAAGALENLALHGCQQGITTALALGSLERFVRSHRIPVIATTPP